jgi:hypothetical protein
MPKAKNARVWERADLEWYVEPTDVTRALLKVERFTGMVLDPCCGSGNIVKTMREAGGDAFGRDIKCRVDPVPEWFLGEMDFLNEVHHPVWNLVMNPPFYRAAGVEGFIRKGLEVCLGKMAVFCDVRFLTGAKRASGLFTNHPPHRVYILTPRPSCPPGEYLAAGNKAGGGQADWCWMVWDRSAPPSDTRISWLSTR